jgi:hypothetical protein
MVPVNRKEDPFVFFFGGLSSDCFISHCICLAATGVFYLMDVNTILILFTNYFSLFLNNCVDVYKIIGDKKRKFYFLALRRVRIYDFRCYFLTFMLKNFSVSQKFKDFSPCSNVFGTKSIKCLREGSYSGFLQINRGIWSGTSALIPNRDRIRATL